jgi:hypothetical protein
VTTHPLANLFPLMEGEPFRELCESIRTNGLIHPIIRDNGVIVDGRNRQLACEKTGRPPHYREFSDLKLTISVEEYIWSTNVLRRHLTDDQRAAIQMAWKPQAAAEAKESQTAALKKGTRVPVGAKTPPRGKTRKRLADQAGVSEHKMRQAETIADQPELLEQVKAGTLALKDAVKQAKPAATNVQPSTPITTGKRLLMRQKAHKQKMIVGLSAIGGACWGLLSRHVDASLIRAVCTPEEIDTWHQEIVKARKDLKEFDARLVGRQ